MPRSIEAENFYPYYVRPRTKGGRLGTIGLCSDQVWGKSEYHQDRTCPNNEVYPYLPISLASVPPPTLASRVFPTKVPVSDDWKGLAACGVNDPKIDEVSWGGRFLRAHGDENLDRPEGEPIGDRTAPFIVNNIVLTTTGYERPQRFFQRDEFVLTQGPSNLDGIMP